jgi:poly[ADP-ribose] polymerase 16
VQGHSGMYAAVQQSCSIFRVLPASGLHQHSNQGRRIIAYHGTDFANVHSILHQGLLAASGTRLQTTGAVFGQGIYLSTDFSTAFQYTKGREGWQHSTLGGQLRCVLVCEVAEEATVPESITRTGKHSR